MAGSVHLSYDQMQQKASSLRNGQHEIHSSLQNMNNLIKELVNDGFVTERASKTFEQNFDEFTKGAQKTIEGLDGMAKYLEKAIQTYQDTDSSLAH